MDMSKRKPYNDRAGYIASRHNLINNGWVVIYRAAEQGMDTAGGPYVVVCELHATLCNVTSLPKARPFLKYPEFCEECAQQYRAMLSDDVDEAEGQLRHDFHGRY